MSVYTYHLTPQGVEAWHTNERCGNGISWRDLQIDFACVPARARGCDGVRIVAPGGEVLAELYSLEAEARTPTA